MQPIKVCQLKTSRRNKLMIPVVRGRMDRQLRKNYIRESRKQNRRRSLRRGRLTRRRKRLRPILKELGKKILGKKKLRRPICMRGN